MLDRLCALVAIAAGSHLLGDAVGLSGMGQYGLAVLVIGLVMGVTAE